MEGYCVKCRAKSVMENPKKVTIGKGRAAMKGKCPKCETTMMRFVSATAKVEEPKEDKKKNSKNNKSKKNKSKKNKSNKKK